MNEAKTLYVTDPDLARPETPERLTPAELVWLANQEKKRVGLRSKYVPHQGAREITRRLRRRAS